MTAACGSKTEPPPVASRAEEEVAHDLVKTAEALVNQPPEPIPAATKQAAVDPKALLGTWNIRHIVYIQDGKPRPPEQPIVEGAWTFEDGGRFVKKGGNEAEGTFVLTADGLVISAFGTVEYSLDKLTATELVVTQMITENMGSTTVLDRVP
ncbi:lipocalin family protein [Nannocystis pusilla]|uniref:lipocalin family protein n=1 Tax=Nannocystis pusilla TaxID=889268 RepID=UPI003B76513B